MKIQQFRVKKVYEFHPLQFQILALHKTPVTGGWTIFPFLPIVNKNSSPDTKWFVFLSESAEVDVDTFDKMISKYSSDEEHFIGHSLISHGDKDIQYPDLRSGFILSRYLLIQILRNGKKIETC